MSGGVSDISAEDPPDQHLRNIVCQNAQPLQLTEIQKVSQGAAMEAKRVQLR